MQIWKVLCKVANGQTDRQTDRQTTDRQTNNGDYITSLKCGIITSVMKQRWILKSGTSSIQMCTGPWPLLHISFTFLWLVMVLYVVVMHRVWRGLGSIHGLGWIESQNDKFCGTGWVKL